jgi:ResB-like family
MLLDRPAKFFTSLRLTVVLLAFAIVLVWVGTVAQADEGLYQAQARYFKTWVVVGANMFGHHIPIVLPGGYLLGSLLLVNLIAAHISRFQFTWKKLGIHVAHGGIILLLVGQLTTDLLSRETMMRFSEGESKNYSESPRNYDLTFTTDAGGGKDQLISIPGRVLAKGGEIKSASLPFAIRVKHYMVNSEPTFRAPMTQNGPPLTTNGVAEHFDFHAVDEVKSMDMRNIPTALIEIVGPNGSLGDWVVSDWMGEQGMIEEVRGFYVNMSKDIADKIAGSLAEPQSVQVAGKKYTFVIRPERVYREASLTLLKFTHAVYPGTISSENPEGIPKDFRSRVRLDNSRTGEHREVEIFMNEPLRYGGETFYQASFDKADPRVSVLQVVHNPGWLTPYIGCFLVGLGLVIQFLSHLIKFISKRKPSAKTSASSKPLNTARAGTRRQPQESVRK